MAAVTGVNQMRLYLTPEELKALDEKCSRCCSTASPTVAGPAPSTPEDAKRVEIITLAYRL